ncbi:MAG: NYN domain-containing protein [Candidatus Tokpelaia sp.]|nr:MAG: NYN domain-containing protein [Candidatus Tokpelaia sp.]KAA6206804.1 MAG: NYN domain-containing protein [Candidatus Tokpelaia sp.]
MRVCFYIDGFNLYHKIAELPNKATPDKSLRWLDLSALAKKLRFRSDEQIEKVYYFSAFADWLPASRQRHKAYVKALEYSGVRVILGKFKEKGASCPRCHHNWKKHEEKESDVNLALQVVQDAYEDIYDRAYIVSADSDMIPAMRMVKAKFPQKEICAVFPPNSGGTKNLKQVADSNKKITPLQIYSCLFPSVLCDQAGRIVACCPQEWC